MIAVECCVKTDGFAAMDADELFFINGGSGSSGSSSTGGTVTQSGTGNIVAINGNTGNISIVQTYTQTGPIASPAGKGGTSTSGGSGSGGGK